jgi:predicted membrane channel-forming protein YqfA (hemolysin III family)
LRGTETILDRDLPLVADHGRGWPAASHLAERLPYQNAIPHGFVMIAAAIHFLAVLTLVRS